MAMKLQLQNFIYDKNSIPYFCKKKFKFHVFVIKIIDISN